MTVSISAQALDRVRRIAWFARVDDRSFDTSDLDLTMQRVADLDEAREHLGSDHWGNVMIDAAGRLTGWLHDRCRNDYRRWNDIAHEVRSALEVDVLPSVREFAISRSLGALEGSVQWNVLHAVMEVSYAECRPPRFFADLLAVYEGGHMACGWDGSWPDGQLLYV